MNKSKITLSNETIDVMKNLSSIGQNLLIKRGNRLRTMSSMKNILCDGVEVEEHFPSDFGIYDLNEFVKIVKSMNEPTLDFGYDDCLIIDDGVSTVRYQGTDPSVLTVPPDRFNEPDCEIHFDVPEQTIRSIWKFGKNTDSPDLVISSSEDTEVRVEVTNLRAKSSHLYSEVLYQDQPVGEFEIAIKLENIKVIPDDYLLSISSAGVTKWESKNCTYWIAGENKPQETLEPEKVLRLTKFRTRQKKGWSYDLESMDREYEKLRNSVSGLDKLSCI